MTVRLGGLRRGVAQPGRAPGSGPGGRRFKSSLPDQCFQSLTMNFWFAALMDVGEIEAAKASEINQKTAGPISKIRSHVFCAIEDSRPSRHKIKFALPSSKTAENVESLRTGHII
jgi:hypothetical protein